MRDIYPVYRKSCHRRRSRMTDRRKLSLLAGRQRAGVARLRKSQRMQTGFEVFSFLGCFYLKELTWCYSRSTGQIRMLRGSPHIGGWTPRNGCMVRKMPSTGYVQNDELPTNQVIRLYRVQLRPTMWWSQVRPLLHFFAPPKWTARLHRSAALDRRQLPGTAQSTTQRRG